MITINIEEKDRIESIIKDSNICFVSIIDKNGLPYAFPMNFGYKDEVIYLHSGQEGGSIEALKENPNICITFCPYAQLGYQDESVACSYRMKSASVICRGKVEFESDFDKKVEALNIIMGQYSPREFKYSDPAVNNVLIWKVEIESMTSKQFGAPNPNSRNYKDRSSF